MCAGRWQFELVGVCVCCTPKGMVMNTFWPSQCHDVFVYLQEIKYMDKE